MAFDDEKFRSPAIASDVGLLALRTAMAISSLAAAIRKIAAQANVDVTKELDAVVELDAKLDKMFDELTGWTPDK